MHTSISSSSSLILQVWKGGEFYAPSKVVVIYEELREWIVTNKRDLEAVFFMLVQVGLAALGIMALLFVLTAGGGGNSDYGYYDDVDEYPIRR